MQRIYKYLDSEKVFQGSKHLNGKIGIAPEDFENHENS